MTEHVDLDALADLVAGEASPETAAHVAGCAACAADLAELQAVLVPDGPVAAALAALPAPQLPDDVAARLDAALAAEREPARARDTTVVPLGAARSRRTSSWLPALGGVAAAAALVVGAVVLAPSGKDADSNAGTPLSERATIATSSTDTDYGKDGKALQAALPLLLEGQPEAKADARATDSAAGTAAPEATSLAMTFVDPLEPLRDEATLAACLASLTDPGDDGVPLALDYARFQGQPALVVVLPTSKADKVDVFVVGPGCSPADEKLLFYTRLTKP